MGNLREEHTGGSGAGGNRGVGVTGAGGLNPSAGWLTALGGFVLVLVGALALREVASLVLPVIFGLLIALIAWPLVCSLERRGVRHGFSVAGTHRGRPRRSAVYGRRHRALNWRARGPDPQVRGPPERGTRDAARSTRPTRDQRRSQRRGCDHLAGRSSSHSSNRWRRRSRPRRGDVRPRVHHDLRVGGREVGSGASGYGIWRSSIRSCSAWNDSAPTYGATSSCGPSSGLFAAALSLVLLLVLDVPLPALWAILVFVASFIPNIGTFIAVIPPTILAYLDGGLGVAVIVIIGYALINFAQDQFLQPVVMGSELNLSPLAIFIAVIVWVWILGAPGALLAVPLTLGLVTTLEVFPSSRAWRASSATRSSRSPRPSCDAGHRIGRSDRGGAGHPSPADAESSSNRASRARAHRALGARVRSRAAPTG